MPTQLEFIDEPAPLPVSQWVSVLKFTVPGKPEPRGSKTTIVLYNRQGAPVIDPKTRRVVTRMIDDNPKSDSHMALVGRIGKKAMAGRPLLACPIALAVRFYFKRPKRHFGTGRNAYRLRADAPECHTQVPDFDKCFRCLGDGLTGAVYTNDKLITATPGGRKYWGGPSRSEVQIFIRPIDHAAWLEASKF